MSFARSHQRPKNQRVHRWCNWSGWCTQVEKLDILLFVMLRCPFSGVELRGKVHPQKFWFVENSGEIPENSVTEVRHVCLLLSYLTFFSEKKTTRLVQCKCAHSWAWKIQLSLSGKCSMVWSWAKTNEGLLVGFKSSHLPFAVAPNFHCVRLFASANR